MIALSLLSASLGVKSKWKLLDMTLHSAVVAAVALTLLKYIFINDKIMILILYIYGLDNELLK